MLLNRFVVTSKFLVLLIFILNIVILFPHFFPNLNDIGTHDETFYLRSGKELAEGTLPIFAWNPLVAVLYALLYIPVCSSPFWLIHLCTMGRFIIFALLWFSTYLIAKQLSSLSHPLIMATLLMISPALTTLVKNPSDGLFAAMSGFAFWQVVSFYNNKRMRHLWISSFFVALAALSRNDGLVLFIIFTLLSVYMNLPFRRIRTSLAASITPFTLIVGGYLVLFGLSTGKFESGIVKRTYEAFEQGQGVAYSYLFDGKNPFVEGMFMSWGLYGTAQENRYSVISAIRRNPRAFFQRVKQTVKMVPNLAYFIYGSMMGIVFFLFAIRGAIAITNKKLLLLLSIILLWPMHLFAYLLTFFRPEYFLLPYFVVFLLTSVGIDAAVSSVSIKERIFWLGTFFGLSVLAIVKNNPTHFAVISVILLGFGIIWIVMNYYKNFNTIKPIGLLLALSLALLVKGYYVPNLLPKFRTLGVAPDEKAALFMGQNLQEGSRVGSWAASKVTMANMTWVPLYMIPTNINDQELIDMLSIRWMLKAIYADPDLKHYVPHVYRLIERQIGKGLKVAYTSDDGTVQVLFFNKRP